MRGSMAFVSVGVNAASSSLARRQRQFFPTIRELVKTTMTEYMHVSTASTVTKIVECTVSDSPVKVCNDTQGAEEPFFEFTPSGYWDYHDPDADWGGDCMTGSNQSPIDITSGTQVIYTGLTFASYNIPQTGSFTFSDECLL